MNDTVKAILVTVGAGVILAVLIGGGNFVVGTETRLGRMERHLESIDATLKEAFKPTLRDP